MTDARYWPQEFMAKFIEQYKSYPCLWKIKCKDYTNKNLKNECYNKLLKLCKTIYPEANREFVVKKIQSIRGSFRKEMKKLADSKRSGASADDIYVPSLWYFDSLLFTMDQELPTASISNLEENTPNLENLEQEEENLSQMSETEKTVENEETTNIEIINTPTIKKKRKRPSASAETQEFLNICKVALAGKRSDMTEFEGVGVNVARKLERMHPTQALYAESLINSVLREGLFNRLGEQSDLCHGKCKVPSTSTRAFSSTGPWQPSYDYHNQTPPDGQQNSSVSTFYDNSNNFFGTSSQNTE